MRKLLVGYDIGSSSVKTTILNADTGKVVASESLPKEEMLIESPHKEWAEQDPMMWWKYIIETSRKVTSDAKVKKGEVQAIGISYQMHGLVLISNLMAKKSSGKATSKSKKKKKKSGIKRFPSWEVIIVFPGCSIRREILPHPSSNG